MSSTPAPVAPTRRAKRFDLFVELGKRIKAKTAKQKLNPRTHPAMKGEIDRLVRTKQCQV